MRFLFINGPNVNITRFTEPGVEGEVDYNGLLDYLDVCCQQMGIEPDFFQSNHEGAIIDAIQEADTAFDGIVINPGAYTHYSYAIHDALKAVSIPAVEVHISAVETREDFRQVSYARLACFATITGEGLKGYAHALELLRERLEK